MTLYHSKELTRSVGAKSSIYYLSLGFCWSFFVHVMRTHNPRNRTIYTRKYNVQTDKQTTDKDNFYYWISNLLFLRLQYTSINHNALSSAKHQKSNLQSVSYVVYHFCNVYKSITSFRLDFDLSCKKSPKVCSTFSGKHFWESLGCIGAVHSM